jgi:hypothetical protein
MLWGRGVAEDDINGGVWVCVWDDYFGADGGGEALFALGVEGRPEGGEAAGFESDGLNGEVADFECGGFAFDAWEFFGEL